MKKQGLLLMRQEMPLLVEVEVVALYSPDFLHLSHHNLAPPRPFGHCQKIPQCSVLYLLCTYGQVLRALCM